MRTSTPIISIACAIMLVAMIDGVQGTPGADNSIAVKNFSVGNELQALTLTAPQQKMIRKMVSDLYTRIKNLDKSKKVALMVEHDNGLHIRLQCILKAKLATPVSTDPTPTKETLASATSIPAKKTHAWAAPIEPTNLPTPLVSPVNALGLAVAAAVPTANVYESSNNDDLIIEANEIERVLKTIYLNGLNDDETKIMCDFLNSHFKLPNGFIQGFLANNFDDMNWEMAEKYTGSIL